MLNALKRTLDLHTTFDACIWAAATCAFWGLMRFGEVTVPAYAQFDARKYLTQKDVQISYDIDGKRYARLDLPSAKTAKPGDSQSVFITDQLGVCPIEALLNLSRIVPAGPNDPLFCWRDGNGIIRPLVKKAALGRINSILGAWGWGTTFGHSFRIGGSSFFLAQGVDPEMVRLAGRWKSLAYETYIRAFEQIASRHMANLSVRTRPA
jgi:hypothetical protein